MNSLDNLAHDLEGELLAQMVTQTLIKTRVLGKSEMPECEYHGLLFATGNNIRALGDMVRRTLESHLDAKTERPEQRKFEFDPIKRVLDNRGAYIAAAITISRAYQVATSKLTNVPAAGGLRPLVQGGARTINLAGRERPSGQHGGGAGGRPTACGCAWTGTPLAKNALAPGGSHGPSRD